MITSKFLSLIKSLLSSLPSYVLGCLPTIATIGASPMRGFLEKLMWVYRCLGCPFTGLYYTCNINNDETSLCCYWLEAKYFISIGNHDEETFKIEGLPYRPIGIHYKSLIRGQFTKEMKNIIEECTAQASVLERLSSLPPAYYMGLGIFAGISRLVVPRDCEYLPHITLALSWTFPAIFRRIFGGILVVKDPNEKFKLLEEQSEKKISKKNRKNKQNKKLTKRTPKIPKIPVKYCDDPEYFYVILTGLISIIIPWTVVILAKYTPPVGCKCICKYLSTPASIWSFNSFLALIQHLMGEQSVKGNKYLHIWFSISGIIVFLLLIAFVVVTSISLWVDLFGVSCSCTIVHEMNE
ncbi:8810_t:CDS:1 [Funneliformis geosporum]|uniref:9151_t:CDS:1 n=1 Tax=Funneliformis geosporum TaxID=1117311 RepID=A0A9W4T1Q0_9GLOM|nr:8810_t:CDS:1 [Funneliformis geosporum]CAI2188552.1 9151_t:CDS:1 [Funneliformis geosporum]